MNCTKENAVAKCCETIKNSWTWARLTAAEVYAWEDLIFYAKINGSAEQRWCQTMNLYKAFLAGCGYNGPNWREPDPDNIIAF